MESNVVPPKPAAVAVVARPVPSLQNQCLNYIGENAQKIDLIDNLPFLPAELGVETIVSVNDSYIKKNKRKLITLAKLNTLDSSVSCVIADQLDNVGLAYSLAKRGPITNQVASIMIKHFIEKTNLKTCLRDFDFAFNKAFPNKILGNDNSGRLYSSLLELMTNDIYDFQCIAHDDNLFSVKDFESNYSLKEITPFLPKTFDIKTLHQADKNNLITLNSDNHLLAFSNDGQMIQIINTKTGNYINIDFYFDEEMYIIPAKLIFNQEGSQLGILDKNNKIHIINIPIVLLNNTLSLQELTALVYCKEHLFKQITIDDQEIAIEYILFEDTQEAAHALSTFIAKHPIIESFLQNFSAEQLSILKHSVNWSLLFRTVANEFSMTEAQVAIKINEDDQFIYQIIEDVVDEHRQELFKTTFWNKDAMLFFYGTIVPILNN